MKRAGKCTTPTLTTTTKNQITTKSQLANATDRLGLRVTNLQSKERQELPRRERIWTIIYLDTTQFSKKNSAKNVNKFVDAKCGLMWGCRIFRIHREDSHLPLLHRSHQVYNDNWCKVFRINNQCLKKSVSKNRKINCINTTLISKQNY